VKPEQVPDELVDVFFRAWLQARERGDNSPNRAAIAAVLADHERQVREQVAKDIEDYFRDRINDVATSDEADRALTRIAAIMYRDARIARGEQP